MKKPRLALTAGDPAGIGYEIACKFLSSPASAPYDITLIGHKFILEKTARLLGAENVSSIRIIEPRDNGKFDFGYGRHDPLCGKAAMNYIERGVSGALSGEFDGIVTCPINKKSIKIAGYDFPGHTEYLGFLAGTKNVSMLLAGKTVKTILATTHCPVSKISDELTFDKIYLALENAYKAGRYFGARCPQIAVCSLNPHGGDAGAIGNEENDVILPAMEKAREAGFPAEGPFPADTLFVNAFKWDFIVAMYHDQGMIAVKMDSFGEAVNVTLNLPFIRTSVDHGTAFDIAGNGTASFSSLEKAIKMANDMAIYDESYRSL